MKTWTDEQQQIFDDVSSGQSLVVEAAAGSGKTTTGQEAVSRARGTVMQLAYNTAMAAELTQRAPETHFIKTLHGLGFIAIRNAFPQSTINARKGILIAEEIVRKSFYASGRKLGSPRQRDRSGYELRELPWTIKRLSELLRESQPANREEARQLIKQHINVTPKAVTLDDYTDMALAAVKKSVEEFQKTGMIDFPDQIYLPRKLMLNVPTADVILIDELQDLSNGQQYLCTQAMRSGAQTIALGSDWQSLYRFRGASIGRVEAFAKSLDVPVRSLSTSFRCSHAVTDHVRSYLHAPIVSRTDAPDGSVTHTGASFMLTPFGARSGDMILSYTNAELLGIWAFYRKEGIKAFITGLPAGKELREVAQRHGIERVGQFASTDKQLWEMLDRICAVLKLSHLTDINTLAAIFDQNLSDTTGIELTTIHKAKGREANRVWVLTDTIASADKADQKALQYVARTRARNDLFIATSDAFQERNGYVTVKFDAVNQAI